MRFSTKIPFEYRRIADLTPDCSTSLPKFSVENAGNGSHCQVNVNIDNQSNLSSRRIWAIKRVMSRPFAEAGVTLVFDGKAKGSIAASVNLHIVDKFPQEILEELKDLYDIKGINVALVAGYNSRKHPGEAYIIGAYTGTGVRSVYNSYELGKTGGHEIGHFVLYPNTVIGNDLDKVPDQSGRDYHPATGIMRGQSSNFDLTPNDNGYLEALRNGDYSFTSTERSFLKKCQFAPMEGRR